MAHEYGSGLAGKRVIVTGGAGGIGSAVVRHLVRLNAAVCAVDRIPPEPYEHENNSAMTVVADLSSVRSVAESVQVTSDRLGGVDCLVHAAAVLERTPFLDVDERNWDLHMSTNLKSTFFLAQECARVMCDQGSGGRIVAIASDAWWTGGFDGSLCYAASKGGVVTLVRGLARELAPFRITVNAVSPGMVDTQMLRGQLTDDQLAAQAQKIPLERLGRVDDVAGLVEFILSDAAEYITGANFNVSGGLLMY